MGTESHPPFDWIAFFSGIATSIIATWLFMFWDRWRAYWLARKLIGDWTAHNIGSDGKPETTEMENAWVTHISMESRWIERLAILRVTAHDDARDGRRMTVKTHKGFLTIDPACP